jgi:hypothetical protein
MSWIETISLSWVALRGQPDVICTMATAGGPETTGEASTSSD